MAPPHYLLRDDVRLFYERAGRGAPVLLIQGVGATAEGWRLQVDELAGQFETLIFDNRGIGRSLPCRGAITLQAMARDAVALLDESGWDAAHLVGHSMGGLIAQQVALEHPSRLRSLSLLCTFSHGRQAMRLTPWILWMSLRTRLGTGRLRRRAFLEILYPASYRAAQDLDQLVARTQNLLGRDLAGTPPIILRQLTALWRQRAALQLPDLSHVPTLILSAEQDPVAPPAFGRDLAKRIPGSRFEIIPQSSHAVIFQEPKLVNERLRQNFRAGEAAWGRSG